MLSQSLADVGMCVAAEVVCTLMCVFPAGNTVEQNNLCFRVRALKTEQVSLSRSV